MKDVFWTKDGVRNEITWRDSEAEVSRYQAVDHIIDSVKDAGDLVQNKAAHMKLAGRVPISLHNEWVRRGSQEGTGG